MKKAVSLLFAFLLPIQPVVASVSEWTLPLLRLETYEDYERMEKVKKGITVASVLGLVTAGALLKYANDMEAKADRVVVPLLAPIPNVNGHLYHPAYQPSLDFQARMRSKEKGARTAAVVLTALSVFGLAVRLSLRF